jgi:hypothetical protein
MVGSNKASTGSGGMNFCSPVITAKAKEERSEFEELDGCAVKAGE